MEEQQSSSKAAALWEKHKVRVYQVLAAIAAVPVLLVVGVIAFSITTFAISLVLILLLISIAILVILSLFGIIQLKYSKRQDGNTTVQEWNSVSKNEAIIVNGKVVKDND